MTYHMFFGFNLSPGADVRQAARSLENLTRHLVEIDLLQSVTPLQIRDRHPVLDTANDMTQTYFATMTFRDRAQADACVAHVYEWSDPTDHLHKGFIGLTTDQVFICFEDQHRIS